MIKRITAMVIYLVLPIIVWGAEGRPFVLKGKVVDINAQPVAGAEIAAYETFFHSSVEESKPLAELVKTDSKGNFDIKVNIKSQRWVFIVVRKEGFALGWDFLSGSSTKKVEGNFNIVLERPQVLAGKLLDESGRGIPNLTIQAIAVREQLSQRGINAPRQWLTAQTDNEGNFVFDNFAAEVTLNFVVNIPGREITYKFTPFPSSACGYEVGKKDVRLTVPTGAKIEGRVIDRQTGKAAAYIDLELSPDIHTKNEYFYFPIQVTSGADGKFTINNVPPGNHNLKLLTKENEMCEWISKYKAVVIKPQESIKEVSFAVEKGGFIEAAIFDAQTQMPLSGASLYVENRNYTDGRKAYFFQRSATTNSNGIVRIAAPLGKCQISAWKENSHSQKDSTITVSKNRILPIKFFLSKSYVLVSGTVVDKANKPVSGAYTAVLPVGDRAFTDNAGGFAINNGDMRLPPELLYVRDEAKNLAAAVKITNASKPVKAVLGPGLTFKGFICDTYDRPVPAAKLRLIMNLSNFTASPDIEVLSGADGRFTINAIAPLEEKFTYRYSISASGYGPVEYRKITIDGRTGETIDLGTIKLKIADQSVSGIVVDAQGRPAPSLPVFCNGIPTMPQPHKTTVTDSKGRFVFNRICEGPVRIQANFASPSNPGQAGFLEVNGGEKDVKVVIGTNKYIKQRTESALK